MQEIDELGFPYKAHGSRPVESGRATQRLREIIQVVPLDLQVGAIMGFMPEVALMELREIWATNENLNRPS